MNATMVANGTKAVPPVVSSIQDIPLAKIRESKTNPRRFFDEAKLAELADNIRQHGVLQRILLRPLPEGEAGTFELVAGTRRYRASKLAKRESIPATGRDLTEAQALELQVIENVQRVDVHPLDEAQETRGQSGRFQHVRACLMRAHYASEGQLCLAGTPRRKAWPTALLRLQPTCRCRFQGSDKLPGTQRPSCVHTFANRARVRIGIEQDLADIAPLRDVVRNIYDSDISKTRHQTGTISENVPFFSGFSTGLSRVFVPELSESSGVNPETQSSGINPLLHGCFPFWRELRYRLGQIFPFKDERAGDGPVVRVIDQADGWPGDGESFS